jgi:hypothetical protein
MGFILGVSVRWTKNLLKLNRDQLSWVVGLLRGHFLPKRAPFQIGVDWWSHLRKVPRRRRISHTYSVWLWGCSSCKISSPGPDFHGTKWLLWRPHIHSPTLHSRCGINKGLIKRGITIDYWMVTVQGLDFMAHHLYIHTYIHTHIHTYIRTWAKYSTEILIGFHRTAGHSIPEDKAFQRWWSY